LSGVNGKIYVIETSTNLMDWEVVGEVTLNEDGSVEFEDVEALKHPRRFYRVLLLE